MNSNDIKQIYGEIKNKNKIKNKQIKKEKDINDVLKLILENPGIYVNELTKLSGKCSEIINRCLKHLVKKEMVIKTKWFGNGIPHRVCLHAKEIK